MYYIYCINMYPELYMAHTNDGNTTNKIIRTQTNLVTQPATQIRCILVCECVVRHVWKGETRRCGAIIFTLLHTTHTTPPLYVH